MEVVDFSGCFFVDFTDEVCHRVLEVVVFYCMDVVEEL